MVYRMLIPPKNIPKWSIALVSDPIIQKNYVPILMEFPTIQFPHNNIQHTDPSAWYLNPSAQEIPIGWALYQAKGISRFLLFFSSFFRPPSIFIFAKNEDT